MATMIIRGDVVAKAVVPIMDSTPVVFERPTRAEVRLWRHLENLESRKPYEVQLIMHDRKIHTVASFDKHEKAAQYYRDVVLGLEEGTATIVIKKDLSVRFRLAKR